MKNKLMVAIIAAFGVLLFLSFRTTSTVEDPWRAPSWTDTLKNPFQLRGNNAWGARMVLPSVLDEGQELYNTYCLSCHGKTGRGDGAPGMNFSIKPANFHDQQVINQKDGAIFWKISEGRGLMPSYKGVLSAEKRWKLVTYIRQLSQQKNIPSTSPKPENLLPAAGYKMDAGISSQYFPIPHKLSNVVGSEAQVFMIDTVVSGLTRPWSMVFLPDKSVLIAERSGKLLRVKNGKVQPKPVGGNVPKELRDIKLDREYEKNGLVYISYYEDPVKREGGYSVLMRAKLEGDRLVENKILYKAGPFKEGGFWFGSKIAFDKEGYLYFTVGTVGGTGSDNRKNAQNLSNPTGKIMRFNRDGSIPTDNPFISTPGALPEIYSYGHRMPEGLTYDSVTNEIWATEFGELGGDEVNIIKPGANYGWPDVTFSLEYSGKIISKDSLRAGIEAPIHHMAIAPSDLCFVYGDRYPGWNGNLFIGGLRKSSPFLLRTVIKNKVFIHDEELLQNIGRVRDVQYAPDKLLYVMTEDTGIIVRLIPARKK